MEFVIVTYPTTREVRMDGLPFGNTGIKQRVEAGTHRFDLGIGTDYAPSFDERTVIGTTFETPMLIPFVPAAAFVDLGEPMAAPAPRRRKPAARRRKKAKSRPRPKARSQRKSKARAGARKKTARARGKRKATRARARRGTAKRRTRK